MARSDGDQHGIVYIMFLKTVSMHAANENGIDVCKSIPSLVIRLHGK